MTTPSHRPSRPLHRAALALLLVAGSAWSQSPVGADAPEVVRRLATDDPQVQAARWGALATMAGRPWLNVAPGELANVWRNARWVVPGASMRFQRGFCIALKCQASDYLVQYNEQSRQLEFFEDGAMTYTGHVQGDGSVRLMGTGLIGVLTAETLRHDAATGAVFANAHELRPGTAAQLASATRGFVPDETPRPAAAPAPASAPASDADLRAELAAMRAKVDQLSRQLEQVAPAPSPAASAPPAPLTPAQARAKAAEEKRLADAKAREEAQARAAQARRAAEEKRARAEEEQRLAAEARAREAEARAAEARRAAEERRAQQEAARREAEAARAREAEAARAREADAARAREAQAARAREAQAAAASAGPSPGAGASAAGARSVAGGDESIRSGTYSTGTGYSIDVEAAGDTLVVVEPNKRSEYRRIAPGSKVYRFFNANTGSTFALTVVDSTTLMASRFNSAGEVLPNGTPLKRVGGEPRQAVGDSTYRSLEAVAQKYLQRAQTDPDNAQAWSFCGMAAMARAHGQNELQVKQAAAALKSIATTAQTPCPDAITPAVWNSVP